MDIMELGAIGELVGGVAVLATLIYLALQIRQNTNSLRANSNQSMAEQVERTCDLLIQNEDARDAWAVATGWNPSLNLENPENLSESALTQFHLFMYRIASGSQNQYQMWRGGTLGAAEFEQLKTLMRVSVATPAAIDWWEHQAPGLFDEDFVRFVQSARGSSPYTMS